MMAKMFYTLEEAKNALSKSEEEIKQLTREGRLREFRDGPRLMFKADQVEQLKGEIGGMDQVDLGPSDTGAPIGLVDSRSGSGPMISLADSGLPSPGGLQKDDTALAADLGLSGSLGGMPSPARPGQAGSGLSGLSGSAAGKSGVNVFGDDSNVDPSAQTAINPVIAGSNMEGMGSGSGLLDLTRESDDTSLGAVLNEIPGGRSGDSFGGSEAPIRSTGAPSLPPAPRSLGAPVYQERFDRLSPAFGGLALGGSVVLGVGIFALASAVLGVRPEVVQMLDGQKFFIILAIALAVAVVGLIGGLIAGSFGNRS